MADHATLSPSTPTPSFTALGLPHPLARVLASSGITAPFPIQAATLPDSLSGRDVLGRGRTGSGKTYAFLLPVVARLAATPVRRTARRPRALILAPTRELVTQIEASLAPLAATAGLRSMTVFGGVRPGPQINALARGVDIMIACPGRLEDLMRSGHADLSGVSVSVLDEADHMADLGFLPAVRRILDRTPRDGQRLLFSATLDAGVEVLVKRYLTDPVEHSVDTGRASVGTMTHHVLHVDRGGRMPVIADLASSPGRTLLFTRTKHGAKALARQLNARGVPAVELHGNLSQGARTRNLAAFSSGKAPTLVATDIAARGIHVDDIALVVHVDPPVEHKAYLHRSGRTARAGSAGTVVTLMLDAQVADVRALTRKAGIKPTTTRVDVDHPVLREIAPGERLTLPPLDLPAAARGSDGSGRRGSSPRSGNKGSRARTGRGRSGARAGSGQRGGGQRDGGQRGGGQRDAGRGSTTVPSGSGRAHSAASFSSGVRGR
jgi:superfamily II DNA/RNA helicase